MPKQITYSHNWNNKLDNSCYTSLRLSGRFNVGDTVEVWCNKRFMHHAIVKGKRRITLDDINEWIAALDTGYSREECCNILRKMYKDITPAQWQTQPIYFYLFQAQKLPITA